MREQFIQVIISGLALGSIYALLGLSLVLIHKATNVINFAQGEMSTFCTFIAFALLNVLGLPLPVVFLLGFPIGCLVGLFVERTVIFPMSSFPSANILIATIGLFIIFNNASGMIWGYDPIKFPSLFPETPISLLGAKISPNSFGIIGVSILIMVALYIFFEHTREGVAMRAASMNGWASQLMGIKVSRVSALSWALASGISMISGMLIAPNLFLDFDMMVSILIKAFAAAILGGFNSLPGAVLGGLTIGLLENVFGTFVSPKFKDCFAFFIIIIVLMFWPEGLFSKRKCNKKGKSNVSTCAIEKD
jgi:branched-chain amino acid transport system permease protein